MQTIETLRAAWKALKLHEEAIMTKKPEGWPRGDWHEANRPTFDTAFRAFRDGRPVSLVLDIDAGPACRVVDAKSNRVTTVSLAADEALSIFTWPPPNDMTNIEFAAVRKRLGLTQSQLAVVLDYTNPVNVSAMERQSTPRAIPSHVARLMRAYDAGYRPCDWPK